jgi:hypothetical protein
MRKKYDSVFGKFQKSMLLYSVLIILSTNLIAQSYEDSVLHKIDPQKLSNTVEKKVSKLEEKVIAKSEKTLNRLQKEEEKVFKKLLDSKDSIAAKTQLEEIRNRYSALKEKLKKAVQSKTITAIRDYVPQLDSLSSALKFLGNENVTGDIKNALSKVESLNVRFQQADEIKQFIRERKEQLKQVMEKFGVVRNLKKINKEVYYYTQQINEYKTILKDPAKIEKKAIELLSKTKVFQDFMKKNSLLASLFRIPGDPNDPTYIASLAGLQTRAQVNSLIQNQIAAGGPNAQQQFSQNLQAAQSQLQQLKDKINKLGGGNSDDIMPEGFKPNNQKTKSFFNRLEYGTDFQTQRATNLFPITSDLGLSIGYKLNDKSIIGFGASYKMGWGSGWNNFHITHQGVGLRSYIDWKLKGSFWISGGYEQNYKTEIESIDQLHDISAWQQSGLIGISKVVSVKSKMFKKTKVQLLWDFLSYKQVPTTHPIIFRIGYAFK